MIILKDGEPFVCEGLLTADRVRYMVKRGSWGEKQLAMRGLAIAEPFEPPKGKVRCGKPRYVKRDGKWHEECDVQDAPPPDEVLLEKLGMSREDAVAALKALVVQAS